MGKILLVDDEESLRVIMGRQLSRAGHDVTLAEDGVAAFDFLETQSFDLVVSDMRMPRMGGMDLLAKARETAPDTEFVVLTGHGSMENAVEAFKTGNVFDYMLKPLHDIFELDAVVSRALERRSLRSQNLLLAEQATTDGLTGLKNHAAFQERLTEEISRSRRFRSPLSLALLDVDHFKQYNDAFGHPAGDEALRRIAAALTRTVRTCDIPARYGGEEFVVILPETDAPSARRAAERIRAAVESDEWPLRPITVSVGVATFTDDLACPADFVEIADRALYRSKRQGRNRVTQAQREDAIWDFARANADWYTNLVRDILAVEGSNLTASVDRLKSSLEEGYDKTVQSWARLLDMRDKETEEHSARVTDLTVRLARHIGMNAEETLYARWGALLHDIGKVAIPDGILQKPGKLTEAEWALMQRHPEIAHEILAPIPFLQPAMDIPYCHHEKWDGTGYPRKLSGEDIPLAARLFAVIDVWDALLSDRPYRPAWSEPQVRDHLRAESGRHFDPRAVNAFLEMIDRGDASSENEPPLVNESCGAGE